MVIVTSRLDDELAPLLTHIREALSTAGIEALPDQWLRWLAEGIAREQRRLVAVASAVDSYSDRRSAAEAADTLVKILPRLRGGDDDDVLARLQQALFLAREAFDAPATSQKSADWHDSAGFLAQSFIFASRSARPDRRLGISNDGPVVGYVQAMLPLLTQVPAPTRDAIVKQLKRRRSILREGAKTEPAQVPDRDR